MLGATLACVGLRVDDAYGMKVFDDGMSNKWEPIVVEDNDASYDVMTTRLVSLISFIPSALCFFLQYQYSGTDFDVACDRQSANDTRRRGTLKFAPSLSP